MAMFQYKGRYQGAIRQGKIEAASSDAAADLLLQQGIIPLDLKPYSESPLNFDLMALFKAPLPLEILVIFCRQLYSLTKAGIPLLRAIKGLAQTGNFRSGHC